MDVVSFLLGTLFGAGVIFITAQVHIRSLNIKIESLESLMQFYRTMYISESDQVERLRDGL